ncbi:MAG: glycosyltransferase family 2 protein [Planctomycetales bacterium]|nr:glycosyltransferase family 2 protein [Planctomycetales bacterium]
MKNVTPSITVLIAVRNEAANIERCLAALSFAERIVVLDSGSTDGTQEIVQRCGGELVQFEYRGGYPKKRQWALENIPIATEWVLLLDADEIIPAALREEICEALKSPGDKNAFTIRKGFHFLGRRFRYGGFSHEAVLLIRPTAARFEELVEVPGDTLDMEVHERVVVEGSVGRLNTPLIHEDFKGLRAYIDKHNHYSTWEAYLRWQALQTGRYGKYSVQAKLLGNTQERRRWLKHIAIRVPLEPWLWFCYHYFFRLGLLEGAPGRIASGLRMQYISNVRAKIYELKTSASRQAKHRRMEPEA